MRDAGTRVNMSYGCDGSGAYLSDACIALRNHFGFTDGYYKNANQSYYYNETKSSLFYSRPVILEGFTSSSTNFFGYIVGRGNGHAWICDGYRTYKESQGYYDSRTDRWLPSYYTHFHMNWGWGGSHDGYFSEVFWGSDINGNPMPHNFASAVGGIYKLSI